MKKYFKMISCFMFNLLLFLIVICSSLKAYASDTPSAPQTSQTKLYYFTDNPNYNYYLNGTIANNGYSGTNVNCYYYPNHGFDHASEFEYEIKSMYTSNFFVFDDSIVIFEMREGLLDQCYSNGTVFAEYLEYIFSDLKEECTNNSIMFICGTDEALFSNYSNFLNYVDIHVNTDIESIFMYNVLKRIEQNTNNEHYTLILDGWCNPANDFLITKYLVPRYRYLYQMYANNSNYRYDDQVLSSLWNDSYGQNHFIQVIGPNQNSPSEYYDYANGYSYSKNSVSYEILENQVYGIGTTFHYINFLDWLQSLDECVDAGYNVEAFLYDILATSLSSYSFDLHSTGYGLYLLDNGYLDTIMSDFINGQNLSIYNNYNGVCVVTYKPLLPGTGGWMEMYIDEEYIECWGKYMDEDNYYKYHL